MEVKFYEDYLKILQTELIPSLGCTEPIAIAYAASKCRKVLCTFPSKVVVFCSGNIIKNVKGVYVPNAGNLKGINAAATIGVVAGNSDLELEVISNIKEEDINLCKSLLENGFCKTNHIQSNSSLHIIVRLETEKNYAEVEIKDTHLNITRIEKDGKILYTNQIIEKYLDVDKSFLNVKGIYDFACNVKIEDIKELIERQIKYNIAICEEGIKNKYGANIGSKSLQCWQQDIKSIAKAYAAAGSDARMSGCNMPVIINAGSGNQGITVSVPIIKYAEHLKIPKDKLLRTLVFSNLLAIYQKSSIGRLSAYCGVVSAACATGAGITFLYDNSDIEKIEKTIINTLATISGMICDGAKPSCAFKIYTALDCAILAHELSMDGFKFESGDGIAKKDADSIIKTVGKLAKTGMLETDLQILEIMTE